MKMIPAPLSLRQLRPLWRFSSQRTALLGLLLVLCALCGPFSAEAETAEAEEDAASSALALEASPLLSSALSLLEEGNFFVARYNALTGSDVRAVFPLGMPYLWGGAYGRTMFSRAPDWYPTRVCYSDSDFFEEGRIYLGGFDCLGYIRWIWLDNHLGQIPSLNTLLDDLSLQRRRCLYSSSETLSRPAPSDWEELAALLTPGDLYVNRKEGGGRHIMMYLGTPRMWGFAEDSVLAGCLDDLLMIHCGLNPSYGERMQRYIDAHPDRYGTCHTTDGGVAVSLLGPSGADAPFHAHVQQTDYDYFNLDGTLLTVYPTDTVIRSAWYPASRFD